MSGEDLRALPYAAVGATRGAYEVFLKDNLPLQGWLAIGAIVAIADGYALAHHQPTLSQGCHELIDRHPWLTRFAIGAVALHLAL